MYVTIAGGGEGQTERVSVIRRVIRDRGHMAIQSPTTPIIRVDHHPCNPKQNKALGHLSFAIGPNFWSFDPHVVFDDWALENPSPPAPLARGGERGDIEKEAGRAESGERRAEKRH